MSIPFHDRPARPSGHESATGGVIADDCSRLTHATRYGTSPWIHQFPSSRVPSFPRYREDRTADVVIIGGGLTGCATAYACAAAGPRHRAARARTRRPGTQRAQRRTDDSRTRAVVSRHCGSHRRQGCAVVCSKRGDEARSTAPHCSAASTSLPPGAARGAPGRRPRRRRADAAARVRRTPSGRARCGVADPETDSGSNAARCRRRHEVRRRLQRSIHIVPVSVWRRRPSAGLAFFERSASRKVRFTRKFADVIVENGTIRTRKVIVATGTATAEFKSLQRHLDRREAYLVMTEMLPAAMRRQLGDRRSYHARRAACLRTVIRPTHDDA